MGKKSLWESSGTVFKTGAVSLAFLIIGYQCAVFVHRVSVERARVLEASPDTVYVTVSPETDSSGNAGKRSSEVHSVPVRRRSSNPPPESVAREYRKVETFRFNPNTVSRDDLIRLGFSERQAQSLDSYRQSGGKFRRREDFAKSYAVPDSVYRRLEKFIDIPKVDINRADSAAFDSLPGIGGWFAARMVKYRKELGGYSYPEQLMDIWHFDRDRYEAIRDLIVCSPPNKPFRLWTLPQDSLKMHPYVGNWRTARAIVLFRENTPACEWSVKALSEAGILDAENASRLERCLIGKPPADSTLPKGRRIDPR